MLKTITSSRVTRSALLLLACGALTGASDLAGQEETGSVEILSGDGSRLQSLRGAAGIRVMSFVSAPGGSTTYRVVEPLRPTEVLAIQESLSAAGYDAGAHDGLLGPATRSALRQFQNASGAAVCGCVNHATIVGLGLRPLVVQTVIGRAADEPSIEIIVPPRPIEPRTAAPPPPPDTVFVVNEIRPQGAWIYPAFPVGVPVIVGPGKPVPAPAPPAGVPFGGRGPIRLGAPATRPPPRP